MAQAKSSNTLGLSRISESTYRAIFRRNICLFLLAIPIHRQNPWWFSTSRNG
jgi:hypothetical protein